MCNYEMHLKHTNTKLREKALLAHIYAHIFSHSALLITLKFQNKAKQRTIKTHTIFCIST